MTKKTDDTLKTYEAAHELVVEHDLSKAMNRLVNFGFADTNNVEVFAHVKTLQPVDTSRPSSHTHSSKPEAYDTPLGSLKLPSKLECWVMKSHLKKNRPTAAFIVNDHDRLNWRNIPETSTLKQPRVIQGFRCPPGAMKKNIKRYRSSSGAGRDRLKQFWLKQILEHSPDSRIVVLLERLTARICNGDFSPTWFSVFAQLGFFALFKTEEKSNTDIRPVGVSSIVKRLVATTSAQVFTSVLKPICYDTQVAFHSDAYARAAIAMQVDREHIVKTLGMTNHDCEADYARIQLRLATLKLHQQHAAGDETTKHQADVDALTLACDQAHDQATCTRIKRSMCERNLGETPMDHAILIPPELDTSTDSHVSATVVAPRRWRIIDDRRGHPPPSWISVHTICGVTISPGNVFYCVVQCF